MLEVCSFFRRSRNSRLVSVAEERGWGFDVRITVWPKGPLDFILGSLNSLGESGVRWICKLEFVEKGKTYFCQSVF